MPKQHDPMKSLRIASPCRTTWESMAGDERVRHCTLCDLNVYNFAELTRDEIQALLLRTEGRVCARLYRRADGTLLTRDCPWGLRALGRRASRLGASLLAALFSIATLASGCASGKARLPRNRSTISLENVTPGTPQETVFAGTVRDDTDNPLPGVNVVVIEEVTGRKTATTSDASGRFAIPSLSSGIYRVDVTLSGFNTATMEHLSLKQGEITRAFVALRLDSSITVVIVGAVAVDPMSNGISTTFPQDLIDKLPIH